MLLCVARLHQSQHRLVDMPIGHDSIAAINGRQAGKIADPPTVFCSADLQWCQVPGFDIRLQHDCSLATQKKRVAKIIPKSTLPGSGLDETSLSFPVTIAP